MEAQSNLAATVGWDGKSRLWDFTSGEVLSTGPSTDVIMTSAGLSFLAESDGVLELIHNGDVVRRIPHPGGELRRDGRYLMLGDGPVQIWNVETGEQLGRVENCRLEWGTRFALAAPWLALGDYGLFHLAQWRTGENYRWPVTGMVGGVAVHSSGRCALITDNEMLLLDPV